MKADRFRTTHGRFLEPFFAEVRHPVYHANTSKEFSPRCTTLDTTKLIRAQGSVSGDIVIESDVWLGARVIVLRGVRIGRGAVVAAGASDSRC